MAAAYAATICPKLPDLEVLSGKEHCILLVCALRGTLWALTSIIREAFK